MYLFEIEFSEIFDCQNRGMRFGVIASGADEAHEIAKNWYGIGIRSVSRSRTLTRSLPHEIMCEYLVTYVIGGSRMDVRIVGGLTAIGVVIQQICNINGVVLGMQRVSTYHNLTWRVEQEGRNVVID